MNTRSLISTAAFVLTSLVLGGASRSEVIQHGGPRLPGNSIPEGSRDICADGHTEEPMIAGLRTGWAFADPRPSFVRLVLSTEILACEEPKVGAPTPDQPCSDGWTLAFSLPSELLTPGVHELKEHEINFAEHVSFAGTATGCQGQPACQGGGGGGGKNRDATIEIYSVSGQCITGNLLRWNSGWITPGVEFTGAFHAVRCTRASGERADN